MRRSKGVAILLASLVVSLSSAGLAQLLPGDAGSGTKRGMQQMNDSGQVGTVTLFRHGGRTLVDVRMHGVPSGKTEAAAIQRVSACDRGMGPVAYVLDNVVAAHSRTLVDAAAEKLLSGNYSVVVTSLGDATHAFACGHLFH